MGQLRLQTDPRRLTIIRTADYQKIGSPAPALGIEDFDSDTIWNAVDVKEEDGCTSSQETSSGLRIDEEITGCVCSFMTGPVLDLDHMLTLGLVEPFRSLHETWPGRQGRLDR